MATLSKSVPHSISFNLLAPWARPTTSRSFCKWGNHLKKHLQKPCQLLWCKDTHTLIRQIETSMVKRLLQITFPCENKSWGEDIASPFETIEHVCWRVVIRGRCKSHRRAWQDKRQPSTLYRSIESCSHKSMNQRRMGHGREWQRVSDYKSLQNWTEQSTTDDLTVYKSGNLSACWKSMTFKPFLLKYRGRYWEIRVAYYSTIYNVAYK